MKKNRVMIIPTFKNNQEYCDLYRINNFSYDKDLELPWSDELKNELDKFDIIYSLVDITNYTSYLELAGKMSKVLTNLCGDFNKIEKIISKYPNKKFGIYFPGPSMYKTSNITWEEFYKRLKKLQFFNKVGKTSFSYFFYMKNWKNLLTDVEATKEFFENVNEKVFYIYQPNDLEYIKSLNDDELEELKLAFNSVFSTYSKEYNKHILDFSSDVPFYNESYYIMPDSPESRTWVQKKEANKDCSNCTAINFTANECSNCYLHQETNDFSLQSKEIYKSNILEIKRILTS